MPVQLPLGEGADHRAALAQEQRKMAEERRDELGAKVREGKRPAPLDYQLHDVSCQQVQKDDDEREIDEEQG